ncbi:ankyrin repeat domain-containing protein [Streptomyces sp. 2P-4]|uniref:ankyrin repeat domain-containing protein n=1 Tax=Streptomyces sp. 2P-4 TaxID=2931974 RepID=UPI0025415904|nr:ankyrin repeat domain-containing protein [Streptomyces sp. 2P-4]
MVENPWTPAHQAVESSDHAALTRLLEEGADVNEVCCGMTLLEHAIDLEGDSALQSGAPIDSRLTVILLAYGADPRPQPPGSMSAVDLADYYGHDIAYRLIDRITSATASRPRSGLWSWRRSRKD